MLVNINSTADSHMYGDNSTLSRAVAIPESILMVHPVEDNFVVPPRCVEYTSGLNEGKCIELLYYTTHTIVGSLEFSLKNTLVLERCV